MNIIQTWKTSEIPHYYSAYMDKLAHYNEGYTHVFFTDETIIKFFTFVCPEYYDTFRGLKYKIQQIDFFRYLAVYHYGGIYLDLDMEIVASFDDINKEKCVFPVELSNTGGNDILVGNYAFYAPKGHPFLKHIIDNIVNPPMTLSEIEEAQKNNGDDKEHVYVYCTTGPELVTRCYWTYPNRDEIELIKPENNENNCFGKYGFHRCFGTWKDPASNQEPMKKQSE